MRTALLFRWAGGGQARGLLDPSRLDEFAEIHRADRAVQTGSVDLLRLVAQLVGAEHLCLGTDMNGVIGYLDGFAGPRDVPMLAAALAHTGFDAAEVRGILGGNAFRVLEAVLCPI
ncbi:membrane dipeptidase [Nocardia brasiliensis]|uniref:membrane dipeptidase n=1 Tax=Nocardia brasiliensis TaxID=37326 RepID=UPI003D906064